MSLQQALSGQLQEFINKLKIKAPNTNLFIQVQKLPTEQDPNHQLVLQVINPAFVFDVNADGIELKNVLDKIEEQFSNELHHRKSILFMMAEGIPNSHPAFSKYLH